MARNNDRGNSRRSQREAARRTKKKPCALCRDKVDWVDYKDVNMLRKYVSDRGKIRSRRVSGNCAQHQRAVALAIKTARELVLLPYAQRTVTERGAGRPRGTTNGYSRGSGAPNASRDSDFVPGRRSNDDAAADVAAADVGNSGRDVAAAAEPGDGAEFATESGAHPYGSAGDEPDGTLGLGDVEIADEEEGVAR